MVPNSTNKPSYTEQEVREMQQVLLETPFVCETSVFLHCSLSVIRSWAGYAPPAAWHRLQDSNLPLPVLETGALPT